jgi:hypothetical protein
MSNPQLNSTAKSWDITASRVYSNTNSTLTLEASGSANLLLKTNTNTIIDADPIGNVTFTNPPICSVYPPTISSQLVNKQYADSLTAPIGAQGASGPTGATGAQGVPSGAQGSPSGAQGSNGAQGANGQQGGNGAQGMNGSQGAQGSGIQGATGNQGGQGVQGSQGSNGAQGATGNQGGQGAQGSTGGTGNQGASGSLWSLSTDGNGNFTFGGGGTSYSVALSSTIVNVAGISLSGNLTMPGGDVLLNTGNQIQFFGGTYTFQFSGGAFQLSDSLRVPLAPAVGTGQLVYGNTNASGTSVLYGVASSERYKTNIQPLDDTDEILSVQPVYFHYKDKDGNAKKEKRIGFIAEEMAENELGKYFLVRTPEGIVDGINPELMIPAYASAMRVLKTRINNLEKVLQDLKDEQDAENAFYEQTISDLESIMLPQQNI